MSMKKFITLTSAALAATAMVAQAELSVDVVSAYVFRGGTISDDVSVQPGFETSILGGAATVGTWADFNTDSSDFSEIDYYVDVPLPLGEDSPVSASVGYTEYVYPGVEGEADREPYLSLGTDVTDGIAASLLIAYGIDGAVEDSLYAELGLETSVSVAEDLAIDLGAAAGFVDPDEGDSGLSHVTLSAGVGLTDAVAVGVAYIIETDEDILAVDEEVVGTLSIAL